MKIWSRTLTGADLHDCAQEVMGEFPGTRLRVQGSDTLVEGPRSRRFTSVLLNSEHGRYYGNSGNAGANTQRRAASYAEWGWWLARLFERDPNARMGDYADREDFHAQTAGEFVVVSDQRTRQVAREQHRIRARA